MTSTSIRISVRGKPVFVPCLMVNGSRIVIKGRILRVAEVFDDFLDPQGVRDPQPIIQELKRSRVADIFSFLGNFADWVDGKKPSWHYSYHVEVDPLAAIRVNSYDHWWKNVINKKTRRRIKKAEEAGVKVSAVVLDDQLLGGIHKIFNETPVRQGKGFWHYGKDYSQVKEEISTYADRCTFLGAYLEGELIGFAKLIVCGNFGRANQILSMVKYRNVPVNNALIAELVRTCESRMIPYLVYGGWSEGSLGDFKQNNGFEKLAIPRYYEALGLKGAIALRGGLHKGLKAVLPVTVQNYYRSIRRLMSAYIEPYKKAYRGSFLIHPPQPPDAATDDEKSKILRYLR